MAFDFIPEPEQFDFTPDAGVDFQPEAPEYPQWVLDISTPEERQQWKSKKPKGIISGLAAGKWKDIPTLGVSSLAENMDVLEAARRVSGAMQGDMGLYSQKQEPLGPVFGPGAGPSWVMVDQTPEQQQKWLDDDVTLLESRLKTEAENIVRGTTIGHDIAKAVPELASFIAAMALTGGVAGGVRQAVKTGLTKAIGKQAGSLAGKALINVAAETAVATARTAVLPSVTAKNITDRMVERSETFDEAVVKGVLGTIFDYATEVSGPALTAIGKGTAKQILGKRGTAAASKSLQKIMEAVNKNVPPAVLKSIQTGTKLADELGVQGMPEEWGEERFADLLKAVFAVEGTGDLQDRITQAIPGGRDTLVELGVLAIPQIGKYAAGYAADKFFPGEAEPAAVKYEGDTAQNIPLTGTEAVLQKVYMKGFAARLTSIRNNADNMLAGAGNKKAQRQVMQEELDKIVTHYNNIAQTIEENPELLAELGQIKSLIPAYEQAVKGFIQSPSKEGFKAIKSVGDQIAELGITYRERIDTLQAEQAAKQAEEAARQAAAAAEQETLPTYEELLERSQAGDTEATDAIVAGKYKTPTEKIGRGTTYEEAKKKAQPGQNVVIVKHAKARPRKKADLKSKKTALVQFTSDLLTAGQEDPAARAYYDKLHAKRKGYEIPGDTWEIPAWIPEAANIVKDADAIFVRNVDTIVDDLHEQGYEIVMFSALDVNKHFIKQIAEKFKGRVIVGGYVNPEYFKGLKNVTFYKSMKEMATKEGYKYSKGTDYRHFKGTRTQPRLCLSKGCLNKCAFCAVPKKLEVTPQEMIDAQVKAMKGLDFEYVYLDDKTFGQANNYRYVQDAAKAIRKFNKNFKGFIVQTTASELLHMNKSNPKFLRQADIAYVELGVETYNNAILAKLHKPAREKIIDQAVAVLRKNNISFIPNIIIGIPYETEATYAKTLDFLKRNADIISHVNVYNLALYADTELGQQVQAKTDTDVNENQVAKSFHENPQIHIDFANAVYEFASQQLEQESIVEQVVGSNDPEMNWLKQRVHIYAARLGMDEKAYRAKLEELTGVDSMASMTKNQLLLVDEYFTSTMKAKGLSTSTAEDLTALLKPSALATTPQFRGGKVRGWDAVKKAIVDFTSSWLNRLEAVESWMVELDGGKAGAFWRTIFHPIATQTNLAADLKTQAVEELNANAEQIFGSKEAWHEFVLAKPVELMPGVMLTPREIANAWVYLQNKQASTHLLEGNFAEFEDKSDVIAAIIDYMDKHPKYKDVVTYIQEVMKTNFPRFQQAMELTFGKEVKAEDHYFTLYLADVSEAEQVDFLSTLIGQIDQEKLVGEPGLAKERTPGAKQPIKLDLIENYFRYLNRVEQFIHLGPAAKQVADILNDREFNAAFKAVHGQPGMQMLKKWLKDAVVGSSTETADATEKLFLHARRAGMLFTQVAKLPSIARQFLSAFTAMSVDPRVTMHYLRSAMFGVVPKVRKHLIDDTLDKSAYMRHRVMDRDVAMPSATIPHIIGVERKVAGVPVPYWDDVNMAPQRRVDRDVAVLAWQAFYKAAATSEAFRKEYDIPDTNEATLVEFADRMVRGTQSKGQAVFLSDLFRGSPLAKLMTTFQTEENTKWNYWVHDIAKAWHAGRITNKQAAYRLLMSYIIPAMVMGMIGRGDIPRSWEEIVFDQATYGLGAFFFVGRIITNALMGVKGGGKGGVWELGAKYVTDLLTDLSEGDWKSAVEKAALAVGAVTGRLPQQVFTTLDGLQDLVTGETDDWRRLIWSDWSLEKYGKTGVFEDDDETDNPFFED
jgi:tRNA A37 methylthiotransferase MiaB/chaperonin cofactor prefoldin